MKQHRIFGRTTGPKLRRDIVDGLVEARNQLGDETARWRPPGGFGPRRKPDTDVQAWRDLRRSVRTTIALLQKIDSIASTVIDRYEREGRG